MSVCEFCGFEAKTQAGLDRHRSAKHSEPDCGPVEGAVLRDLRGVRGSEGLQQSAVKLAARLDESTSARDLPGLAAELRQTLATLGVVTEDEERADVVDQLAARRVGRFADAKDHVVPAEGG